MRGNPPQDRERQTDKDRQTDRQTEGQTNRQRDRDTDRQEDRQTDWLTEGLSATVKKIGPSADYDAEHLTTELRNDGYHRTKWFSVMADISFDSFVFHHHFWILDVRRGSTHRRFHGKTRNRPSGFEKNHVDNNSSNNDNSAIRWRSRRCSSWQCIFLLEPKWRRS